VSPGSALRDGWFGVARGGWFGACVSLLVRCLLMAAGSAFAYQRWFGVCGWGFAALGIGGVRACSGRCGWVSDWRWLYAGVVPPLRVALPYVLPAACLVPGFG
jgi:hypothetical protein